MPFEITVQEKHVDENVTGSTLEADLEAAGKAANARHAYDQVIAGETPTGWDSATKRLAKTAGDVAVKLAHALGGAEGHYKVSIHADEHYVTVHVQQTDVDAPTLELEEPADGDA